MLSNNDPFEIARAQAYSGAFLPEHALAQQCGGVGIGLAFGGMRGLGFTAGVSAGVVMSARGGACGGGDESSSWNKESPGATTTARGVEALPPIHTIYCKPPPPSPIQQPIKAVSKPGVAFCLARVAGASAEAGADLRQRPSGAGGRRVRFRRQCTQPSSSLGQFELPHSRPRRDELPRDDRQAVNFRVSLPPCSPCRPK